MPHQPTESTPDRPLGVADPFLGQIVGDCLLERLLGEGGFGRVYKGHHRKLNIPVAVKLITKQRGTALQRFQREADAAAVFVNASTYFHDGAQFGLGSELGISTQKMHARGPLGLRELTSYKWLVLGNGQIRN